MDRCVSKILLGNPIYLRREIFNPVLLQRKPSVFVLFFVFVVFLKWTFSN